MIYDFLIIGAGISGASAGYELSVSGSTIIVEAESHPGYHSTGRSAALYTPNYGPDLVRLINKQSHAFLYSPPVGFTDHSLLSHRGMMTVALQDQRTEFEKKIRDRGDDVDVITAQEVMSRAPFLRAEQVVGATYEEGVFDMDVHGLHQGYLKGFSRRGGELIVDSPVVSMQWLGNHWVVNTGSRVVQARIVVNAAGAWADEIGRMAGAKSIGLIPRRRTAALIDMPVNINLDKVPALDFMGCENYMKPEKNHLMISPGDESPVAAHDIQPDDLDVAILVDWVESVTQINVSKINHQWAGLRSFVGDGNPVVGFDSGNEHFFWLAGQGGYGIMMAPTLAVVTAQLVTNRCLSSNTLDAGIKESLLSPSRLST